MFLGLNEIRYERPLAEGSAHLSSLPLLSTFFFAAAEGGFSQLEGGYSLPRVLQPDAVPGCCLFSEPRRVPGIPAQVIPALRRRLPFGTPR